MDKLETLRETLYELIAKGSSERDIIYASMRLDKEIVKFMREKYQIQSKQ